MITTKIDYQNRSKGNDASRSANSLRYFTLKSLH